MSEAAAIATAVAITIIVVVVGRSVVSVRGIGREKGGRRRDGFGRRGNDSSNG